MKEQTVRAWIEKGPMPAALSEVEVFGRLIGKDLDRDKMAGRKKDERVTRSQIRQIFTRLKSIESKGINTAGQWTEFMMLKPYLAYAAKRGATEGIRELKTVLDVALDTVLAAEEDSQARATRFNNFCKLFESILAYHRAYGGN